MESLLSLLAGLVASVVTFYLTRVEPPLERFLDRLAPARFRRVAAKLATVAYILVTFSTRGAVIAAAVAVVTVIAFNLITHRLSQTRL